jgi:hypothetical protein
VPESLVVRFGSFGDQVGISDLLHSKSILKVTQIFLSTNSQRFSFRMNVGRCERFKGSVDRCTEKHFHTLPAATRPDRFWIELYVVNVEFFTSTF